MRYLTVIAALLILLVTTASTAHESWDKRDLRLFADALGQVGLTTTDLAFDLDDRNFYGGDAYRLEFFDALIDDPLKISPYTRTLTDQLVAGAGDLGATLCSLQQRTGNGVRLGLIGDPLADYRARSLELGAASLATALAELSWEMNPAEFQDEDYATLPAEVRDACAVLLFATADVLTYRRLAIEEPLARLGYDTDDVYGELLEYVEEEPEEFDTSPLEIALNETLFIETLLEEIDFALLNTGATLLAIACQQTADAVAGLPVPDGGYHFAADTPFGTVVISSDIYAVDAAATGPCLLIVSTGGDNHYIQGAATASFDQPLSVLIDTAGDDTYDSRGRGPALGCGILGCGVLVDTVGNDGYLSDNAGQGCGLFGVGILCDYSGNDIYSGVVAVQGSGTFGTGLLIDRGGADTYDCYQFSQGYGFTMGAGLLLDTAGDDTYTANDTDIRFASSQSAEHNSNLSQGFGFGRRGDYNDGHSWAGGVGMLVDGAGDDTYSCGIFGQGCAYWYGTGILADKGGEDSYLGQWYCQGSGAHFALGILQDDAGDDTYTGVMNMCTGAGHDFSLGWLEDRAGDDRYECPNLSLGGGNANGIGVFWDRAGDDHYLSRGVTLGKAASVRPGSLRSHILTLGLFVDGGGTDTYLEFTGTEDEPVPWPFAANGTAWARPGSASPALPAECGCAIDAE